MTISSIFLKVYTCKLVKFCFGTFYWKKADLSVLGVVTWLDMFTVGLLCTRHGVRHTGSLSRGETRVLNDHLSDAGLRGKRSN